MKTTWLSLALLLIGLSSCNNDEQEIKRGAYVPDGYAGLTIQLATGKAADTKAAVGEPLPGGLTDKEKEIKSIAFFVAIPGEAFQSFLSTREPLTPGGLYEPLTETGGPGSGNYTANIRIKGETFGESEVVVIANYAENNLTAALETVKSMEDLKKVTLTITNRAQNPLLMYNYQKLSLKVGETTNGTFAMTRVVARVDIHNKAVNTTTPSNGFVITSACWVNAKTQAYLTAGHTAVEVNALLVNADKSFATYVPNITDASKVDTLYTYENPNDVSATALEIIGTFRGLNTVKHVDFRRIKTDGTGYETVAIERNKRYVVEITPDKDSTDVKLTINVVDWTLSTDTIKVEETVTKPTLSTITENGLAGVTEVAGSNKKAYTITTPTDLAGTLSFTASGNQETEFEIRYIGRTNAAWLPTGAVTKKEVQGYASAELSSEYTLDFSQIIKDEFIAGEKGINAKVPSDALLLIQNVSNPTLCDTIWLQFRPVYNGLADIRLKPVLMKDGKFWAPVNVGATQLPTTVPTSGDITSTCGQLFQWGRKQGFIANSGATYSFAATNPKESDLEGMEASTSWKNKFIKSSLTNPNTQNNWLRINSSGDNPEGAAMVDDAWYQRLWDSNQVAGDESSKPQKTLADPCPDGWRVPGSADWKNIGAGNIGNTNAFNSGLLKIAGAIGSEILALPAAGLRNSSNGSSSNQGLKGYYWSSSVPSGSVSAGNVDFNSPMLNVYMNDRAYGFSVRCVQED